MKMPPGCEWVVYMGHFAVLATNHALAGPNIAEMGESNHSRDFGLTRLLAGIPER